MTCTASPWQIHPEFCRVCPPETATGLQHTGMWLGGPLELRDNAETRASTAAAAGIAGISDEQACWTIYFMPC
ncbi:hypothetical protein ACFWAY_53475 [Rhodococcus sp. NPDC059968]|uniref:hypothetical protein n=1 Tax=Rhodococcus sp. NPDC059968 TaxID=3347017 RepID=UPI00366F0C70